MRINWKASEQNYKSEVVYSGQKEGSFVTDTIAEGVSRAVHFARKNLNWTERKPQVVVSEARGGKVLFAADIN